MTKNNPNPLVSVIIPVYNRDELLARTLKSVQNQTYRNIEIIVVDDGSSRDIRSVTDGMNDDRIRYIRCDVNCGVSSARNAGIEASTGEYIAFLDSDDEYLPEKIEKQLGILLGESAEGAGVAYCGMWVNKSDCMKYRLTHPSFCKWGFLLQQVMFRKDIMEKAGGFDTRFRQFDDRDFILRLSRVSKFTGTGDPLVIYNKTFASLSRNEKSRYTGADMFLEKHSANLSSREKSHWLYVSGKYSISAGEHIKGYASLVRSYIVNPLNVRSLRKIIGSFPLLVFYFLKSYNGKKRQ